MSETNPDLMNFIGCGVITMVIRVIRGKLNKKQYFYKLVEDVVKLPVHDMKRMIYLGELNKPSTNKGKHLMMRLKLVLNLISVEVVDAQPISKILPNHTLEVEG
ncbi:hypothetical protein L1987_45435 [Smallanthus sonchifolius]|uniref:Uncharacterized protein n=1 Tax=Smallanthus sonchifolius TaxID=185202 RepID=A0ACB9FXL0_9ASTR|nr:hypothetical protein L1987_45435 [Smallanthus sonchifolius]